MLLPPVGPPPMWLSLLTILTILGGLCMLYFLFYVFVSQGVKLFL